MTLPKALNLYYLLDLKDRNGFPDHQKVVPLIVVLSAIALHAVGRAFDNMELVILGAIAFGPRMYGLFLRQKTMTGTSAQSTTTTVEADLAKMIAARRSGASSEDTP